MTNTQVTESSKSTQEITECLKALNNMIDHKIYNNGDADSDDASMGSSDSDLDKPLVELTRKPRRNQEVTSSIK